MGHKRFVTVWGKKLPPWGEGWTLKVEREMLEWNRKRREYHEKSGSARSRQWRREMDQISKISTANGSQLPPPPAPPPGAGSNQKENRRGSVVPLPPPPPPADARTGPASEAAGGSQGELF